MKSYRDLIVWQKAMDLTISIYEITNTFPKQETFALTSQMTRSASSIPSNIAEGQGRYLKLDFLRFLRYSKGSLSELETQVTISQRLNYISIEKEESLLKNTAEIRMLLSGLISAIKKSIIKTENVLSTQN